MSNSDHLKTLSDRITALHRQAMDLAEQAIAAERTHDLPARVRQFYRAALVAEREAAELCASGPYVVEPTRSVLYRSAASLAMECGERSEAERLARAGLAAGAPREIAEELREILGQLEIDAATAPEARST